MDMHGDQQLLNRVFGFHRAPPDAREMPFEIRTQTAAQLPQHGLVGGRVSVESGDPEIAKLNFACHCMH